MPTMVTAFLRRPCTSDGRDAACVRMARVSSSMAYLRRPSVSCRREGRRRPASKRSKCEPECTLTAAGLRRPTFQHSFFAVSPPKTTRLLAMPRACTCAGTPPSSMGSDGWRRRSGLASTSAAIVSPPARTSMAMEALDGLSAAPLPSSLNASRRRTATVSSRVAVCRVQNARTHASSSMSTRRTPELSTRLCRALVTWSETAMTAWDSDMPPGAPMQSKGTTPLPRSSARSVRQRTTREKRAHSSWVHSWLTLHASSASLLRTMSFSRTRGSSAWRGSSCGRSLSRRARTGTRSLLKAWRTSRAGRCRS
mmetsp:Transcript_17851/g.55865  ORF Transcript_17851/g.55865 Transcript_17851/m.55865 type:complete len:310 (+) Transcript_17851:889-1818(+)